MTHIDNFVGRFKADSQISNANNTCALSCAAKAATDPTLSAQCKDDCLKANLDSKTYQFYKSQTGNAGSLNTTSVVPSHVPTLTQTVSPLDSANAFLKAIQNDNEAEAMKWSLLVTNDNDWRGIKVIGKPFLGNSNYTFNGAGVSYGADNSVSLDGTVTASDGSVKNFTMSLEKIDNVWKVTKLGFKITL